MAEHAGKPKVRFAGFTEDWEQRKVGEYYDFKNGLNKGKEYFGIGTPIVNFTDVFHLRGIYEKDLKGKVSLTRAEIANFQVKMGDIFFTRTSETIDEIGFPSVMLDEPKDTVFRGSKLHYILGRIYARIYPLDIGCLSCYNMCSGYIASSLKCYHFRTCEGGKPPFNPPF